MIALSLALLSLAIWLMLVFARGNFWQARETDDLLPPFGTDAGRIQAVQCIHIIQDGSNLMGKFFDRRFIQLKTGQMGDMNDVFF